MFLSLSAFCFYSARYPRAVSALSFLSTCSPRAGLFSISRCVFSYILSFKSRLSSVFFLQCVHQVQAQLSVFLPRVLQQQAQLGLLSRQRGQVLQHCVNEHCHTATLAGVLMSRVQELLQVAVLYSELLCHVL